MFTRKRKDGETYYIQYYYQGLVKREKVGRDVDGVTKRFAEKALASRMGDIAKGRFDIAQTKTYPLFKMVLDKYLEWSGTYKRSHERDLTSSKHLRPFFGNVRIDDVTPFMIERYKSKRRKVIQAMKKNRGKDDRDISFASINRELALLKHLYSMAIKWRIVEKNPVLGVKMFPERKRERYLNGDEIAALLDACERSKNKSLKLIVTTAIYTGGRLREILNIKVREIDFRSSKINLPHTKTGENGKLTMSTNLKEEIKKHLTGHKHEYLFCKDDGTPFNDIRDSFNGALKAAGIISFRFHDLRHTFASQLTMKGVDIRTIQELGRWKTLSMLMRYSHLSPEHMQSAVNTLDDLFQNKHETSTKLISADFTK